MTGSAPLASATQAAILVAALALSPSLPAFLAIEFITQVTFPPFNWNLLLVGPPNHPLLHILGLLQVPPLVLYHVVREQALFSYGLQLSYFVSFSRKLDIAFIEEIEKNCKIS